MTFFTAAAFAVNATHTHKKTVNFKKTHIETVIRVTVHELLVK